MNFSVDDLLVTGRTPTFPGVRTDSKPHWQGRILPRPVQPVLFPRLRGRIADLLAPWHVDAYHRASERAARGVVNTQPEEPPELPEPEPDNFRWTRDKIVDRFFGQEEQ